MGNIQPLLFSCTIIASPLNVTKMTNKYSKEENVQGIAKSVFHCYGYFMGF